jgi:hypothetical protein
MSGSQDGLANPAGVAWTVEQLKHTIIFDHEYYLGHLSFLFGKDMAFMTVDTMAILNHYNGECDEKTKDSLFEVGNSKCREMKKEQEVFLV